MVTLELTYCCHSLLLCIYLVVWSAFLNCIHSVFMIYYFLIDIECIDDKDILSVLMYPPASWEDQHVWTSTDYNCCSS